MCPQMKKSFKIVKNKEDREMKKNERGRKFSLIQKNFCGLIKFAKLLFLTLTLKLSIKFRNLTFILLLKNPSIKNLK